MSTRHLRLLSRRVRCRYEDCVSICTCLLVKNPYDQVRLPLPQPAAYFSIYKLSAHRSYIYSLPYALAGG